MAWGDSVLVLVGGLLRSVVDMYEHMIVGRRGSEVSLFDQYIRVVRTNGQGRKGKGFMAPIF